MLRIHLFGEFRVEIDRKPVPHAAWRSSRASDLVKLLALAEWHRLHREVCSDLFWPNLNRDAATNNFNVAATRARHALSAAGARQGQCLYRVGEAIVLASPDELWIDADDVRDAAKHAWQTNQLSDFHSAVKMIQGGLLVDDRYKDWIQPARDSLDTTCLKLLTRMAQLETAAGNVNAAIETCRQILDREPHHEEAVVMLMQLLEQTGQRAQTPVDYRYLEFAARQPPNIVPTPIASTLVAQVRERSVEYLCAPLRIPSRFSLPRPLDDLIGRARDRAEIQTKLSSSRLLTLTGPGGVGKTRLALSVANDLATNFADGVVFVDFSAHKSAELAPMLIAEALGVSIQPYQSPIDEIARCVESTKLLVLLDNVEHMLEIAPFLQSLLEQTTGLTLLVTSRARLRLSAEKVFAVSPLDLPLHNYDGQAASVELFSRRARAVNPSFRIDQSNLPQIVELCRRVEGLPLALELAAARISVLSPASMLERLKQPLELLAGGMVDLPERQQTMRNTIAWSHALLSQAEQQTLHRLAVFEGGWTLEAAEAVMGGTTESGSTLDRMESLVDKHLVEFRDTLVGMRFSLLVSIRSFCLELAESDPTWEDVRRRHANWCLGFAEIANWHWESDDQVEWLDRAAAEEANLEIALDWYVDRTDTTSSLRLVAAMQKYWFIRGRIAIGCKNSMLALDLPFSEQLIPLRIDALNGLGMLLRDGNAQHATRVCLESVGLARRLGDRKKEADGLANLGFLALNRFDRERAASLFAECLEIYESLGNEQGIADSVSFLALTAFHNGQLARSIELNERSLRIWQALDDHQGVVWAKTRLAIALARFGDLERAFAELSTAFHLARSMRFRWGLSWSLDGLASLSAQLGDRTTARSLCIGAHQVRKESGLRPSPQERAAIDLLHQDLRMRATDFSTPLTENELEVLVDCLERGSPIARQAPADTGTSMSSTSAASEL